MRLGGPILDDFSDPERWIAAVRRRGYSAAYCPLESLDDLGAVRAYADAARGAGVVIAEVGAWSNPLSPDEETRRRALETCQERLALADEIGARCCANIAGSRGGR